MRVRGLFGTRPKRITKLEIFSTIFFLIILFFSGFVSVMTTRNETQPGWKTMRNSVPEPNGDMQKIDPIVISQLIPQTDVTQYRILFDEAHYPAYRIEPNEAQPSGTRLNYRLYLELIALGHHVDVFKPGSLIDVDLLSNYDLLVIPSSYGNYFAQEIDAIESWVNSGGNILIMTKDGYNDDDSRAIAHRFGFEISEDWIERRVEIAPNVFTGIQSYDLEYANILDNALTIDIDKLTVGLLYGLTTVPYNAQKVLKTDSDGAMFYEDYYDGPEAIDVPIMCIIENLNGHGGRLAIFAGRHIWDTDHNYPKPFFYMNDNRQFAVNTFNWLVDKNNTMKIDSDNDTLPDYLELYALNSNPHSNDTDQDNLLDIFEYENGMSLDSNDTDNDGLHDFEEYYNLPTNPTKWDSDGDLLGDGDEYFVYFTNATCSDTDIDGIPDGYEVFNLMDPLDETDAALDYDNDLLTNLQEYKFGGNMYSNDTDSDGLSDSDELFIYFTKIYRNDTDFDGLLDWDELFIYHTDPRDRDTDDDTYPDRLEILEGWDPLDPDDPVPRPWVSEPKPSVQISISIFSILVIVPLIPTGIYIKRKREMIEN